MSGAEPRPRPEAVPDPEPAAAPPAMGWPPDSSGQPGHASGSRTSRLRRARRRRDPDAGHGAGPEPRRLWHLLPRASGTYFMTTPSTATWTGCIRTSVTAGGGRVVGRRAAALSAALLLAGAIGWAWRCSAGVRPCVGVYAGINLAYSVWLKREPILDLAAVASGFLIRAIAGGLAVGVPLSNWFLIVASFGSLFVVAGKRQVDHRELELAGIGTVGRWAPTPSSSSGSSGAVGRRRHHRLLPLGLREGVPRPRGDIYFELTIVPFVLAILRYALLLEGGAGVPRRTWCSGTGRWCSSGWCGRRCSLPASMGVRS